MTQVTFTVTLHFHGEKKDVEIIMLERDKASKLTQYLSKYKYGGLSVDLFADMKKVHDNEFVDSFKRKNLWSNIKSS